MTGKFAPETTSERNEVLRWILFDNHKFTSYFATYRFLKAFAAAGPRSGGDGVPEGSLRRRRGDRREAPGGSKFMVGDTPTIADFSLAGYVFYPVEEHGYDWAKSHPNIHAWTERLRALPGWKDPYELMPGARIKPLR